MANSMLLGCLICFCVSFTIIQYCLGNEDKPRVKRAFPTNAQIAPGEQVLYIYQPDSNLVVEAPMRPNQPVFLNTFSGNSSQYFIQKSMHEGYSILVNVANGLVSVTTV